MAKRVIPTDTWPGTRFANGWEIIRRISKEEEKELGMGTHNAHFECYNHNCGIITCIEKTTLNTYLTEPRDVLYNCRNCKPEKCKYKDKVRKQVGRDKVIADRATKVSVGDIFGNFVVVKILDSTEFGGHQSRAIVQCLSCGRERECLFHHLLNLDVACDCSRNHSIGENLIKRYLENHKIPNKAEYTFSELRGLRGGVLRYDFAVLKENKLLGLIEFDGEQHYQEAGTYFNEDGQVQIHDLIKDNYAQSIKVPLLRIPFFEKDRIDEILDNWIKTELVLS